MGGKGGGGGGGGGTQVQKTEPWDQQKPYLIDIFQQSQNMYNSGALAPDYYAGNTVAPQSQWTQNALQMQADRAMNGSASIDTALAGMDNITSGNALANNAGLNALNQMTTAVNPYMKALYEDAAGQANAQIDSGFSGAGRYGSGAHENAKADAMADLSAQMYSHAYDQQLQAAQQAGQLYNTGIGQQVVAGQTAQQLANQAYTDAAALSEAGGVKDDYQQQLINADIDRYNYESQQPLTALSNYNQLIQGTYGGTSTTTGQQQRGSLLGGALGGAASGAALGSMFGPVGTGVGALAGGLLGLF
jgi:hypothetical protein